MTVSAHPASTAERVSTGWAVTSACVRMGSPVPDVKRTWTNACRGPASGPGFATVSSWWMIIDVDASKGGLGDTVKQGSRCVKPNRASTVLGASKNTQHLAANVFPYVYPSSAVILTRKPCCRRGNRVMQSVFDYTQCPFGCYFHSLHKSRCECETINK